MAHEDKMVSEISVSIEALLRRKDEVDESIEVSVSRTVIIYLATDRGWIQSLILSYSHSDTRRVRNSGDWSFAMRRREWEK